MRYILPLLLIAACAAGALADEAEKPQAQAIYEWPMKACDAGWTGYSPDPRVKPPFRLKWATQPGIAQRSSVSVAGVDPVFAIHSLVVVEVETDDIVLGSFE